MDSLSTGSVHESTPADPAQQMFQFAIDQAPDAVFWMNREAGFSYVNEQACRSLGYTREELLRLHLWDIDPVFPKERWSKNWERYHKDGQVGVTQVETWHRRKDGVTFPVDVSAKHIFLADTEFHVAFVRDITERKRVEQQLQLTQSAIDRASIGCYWLRSDGRIVYANEQACRSLGYTRVELLQLSVQDIDPDFTPEVWSRSWEWLVEATIKTIETTHQRKDGVRFPVEITSNYVEFGGEEYCCAYARDLTERRRAEEEKAKLEAQLAQAQKMESVGRLAGGVAHDFNNMLSVILGYTELIKGQVPVDDALHSDLLRIERAGNHAKETTRQLLAFSSKQVISPRILELNGLILNTRNALARLIGEDIDLRFAPQEDLWHINCDPSQVDRILVNLAVNARDAMPDGGTLTISTSNVCLDEAGCREHLDCEPGEYVLLAVSDNGVGMDRETLDHIFEPFFTTKPVGQGTGLGLATVYGITRQNGGFVLVDSSPGQGTRFRAYFPRTTQPQERTDEARSVPATRGSGTILLVEDDAMVRSVTAAMLESLGFTVVAADTPDRALAYCGQAETPIDLLVTDVVMPGMTGPELRNAIAALRPDIKVLFLSGYTSEIIARHGVLEEGVNYIQKPFSRKGLAQKVRAAIGGC